VPAAGGVQRAFGTDAKSLQVGFAVDAGIRAAQLAAAGAQADPAAVDAWLGLVGGDPDPLTAVDPSGPVIPNGLAIKLYPCCYALQRPISTLSELAGSELAGSELAGSELAQSELAQSELAESELAQSELAQSELAESGLAGPKLDPAGIRRIVLRTPEATVVPLIHHRPTSGLQGKFSLEYAAAAALLDTYPGFGSFTDAAVQRDAAQRLVSLVEVKLDPGGSWLLDGELEAEIHTDNGRILRASQQFPPGSPARPPSAAQLQAKLADCVHGLDVDPASWTWDNAVGVLRRWLPGPERTEAESEQAWMS
jgi:2-methylcitrate dehydratase PrpD